MTYKVSKLPAANRAVIGKSVIEGTTETGEIGRMIEDMMSEADYPINRDDTVDLGELGIEVKSRKIGSIAAHTIGTMTVEDILKTPYEFSPIFKKVQTQYRVKHDEIVVREAEVFDFTDPYIQDKIKQAYEYGRKLMSEGKFDQLCLINGTWWGYWEKKNGNSYAFRIRDKAMRGMEDSKYSSFSDLYEF